MFAEGLRLASFLFVGLCHKLSSWTLSCWRSRCLLVHLPSTPPATRLPWCDTHTFALHVCLTAKQQRGYPLGMAVLVHGRRYSAVRGKLGFWVV